MSRFIPKKTLTESMASNPLDAIQTVSNNITKKAHQEEKKNIQDNIL